VIEQASQLGIKIRFSEVGNRTANGIRSPGGAASVMAPVLGFRVPVLLASVIIMTD
jgi:hypothetical protein